MIPLLLLFVVAVSLYYIGATLFLYRGLRSLKPPAAPHNNTFSVVMAAHNEENNVDACLSSVFRQTLPQTRYEVILVDDRSTDDTSARARKYLPDHSNLSIITVEETVPGTSPKKHALSLGVERARHEIIVFTDADCIVPPCWLETMDRYFSPGSAMVQGVTLYAPRERLHPWLFGLQAIDFLSHAVVSAASIGAGLPVNSNANSFAFRKDIFVAVQGYGAVRRIISGDDDLLMQKIWKEKRGNIRYMPDGAAAVKTAPTETIAGIFEQRKRWGSKTVHYSVKQRLFLSGIFLFYLSIVFCGLLSIGIHPLFPLFLLLLLIKLGGEALLMIPGTRLFGQTQLRKFIIPASLLQLPMVLAAVLWGVFGTFRWKDQPFKRRV